MEADRTLPPFERLRVVVAGDAVADRYVYARPERLSREAPVPVFVEQGEELRPGGAANVAANLAALGARVALVAAIGTDPVGRALVRELERRGVQVRCPAALADHQVPVKTRVLAAEPHRTPQQVLRLDRQPRTATDPAAAALLAPELLRDEVDAVLYSDYGYGDLSLFAEVDAELRRRGVTRVLDPRRLPGPFAALDAVTPNLEDFLATSGVERAGDDLVLAASDARARLGVRALLVTLGNRGMLLADDAGVWQCPPSGRDGVVDVSGAGDTAAAVFAAALALGREPAAAMALANAAAGEVVMRSGTVPVEREALERAWASAPAARPVGSSAREGART